MSLRAFPCTPPPLSPSAVRIAGYMLISRYNVISNLSACIESMVFYNLNRNIYQRLTDVN